MAVVASVIAIGASAAAAVGATGIAATVIGGAVSGALIGGGVSAATTLVNGGSVLDNTLNGAAKGAVIGGTIAGVAGAAGLGGTAGTAGTAGTGATTVDMAGNIIPVTGSGIIQAGGAFAGDSLSGAAGAAGAGTTLGISNSLLGAGIAAGASLYGSNQASNAITNAANQANGLSQQAMQNQVPWMTAGQDALTSQYNLMGLGANGANGASGELTALQQSPGYQFGLSQGQRGLDAGVAARGGMGSGKAATAASQWNQNYANTGYNNRLTQLSGLSQVGQNAASGVGTQLNMQGSNTANAGLASANATMQGTIGAGNALSSFLNPNTLNQSTLGK
jgi:hypothetical protein